MTTSSRCKALFVVVLVSVSLGAASVAQAQEDYQVLKAYRATEPSVELNPLAALVRATDGNIYGASLSQFFRITPAGSYELIKQGTGLAHDPIQAADGFLYSVDLNNNMVRLTLTGDITPVGHIGGQATSGPIEGNDGALYGVTRSGGALGNGGIYRFTLDGQTTPLYDFTAEDGDPTFTRLMKGVDGNFYGATFSGRMFRMTPAGSMTTVDGYNGTAPGPLVQTADGSFFGVNVSGGFGRLFRLDPNGTFTTLHTFSGPTGDGYAPISLMLASDGLIYGTTESSIFSVTSEGTFRLLHRAASIPDNRRYGWKYKTLAEGADGNLYSTFQFGGEFHFGGVFRLNRVRSACANVMPIAAFIDGPAGPLLRLWQYVKTETPAIWGTWLIRPGGVIPLWLAAVPPITPTLGFEVEIPNVPVGPAGVLSIVLTSGLQVCADGRAVEDATTAPAIVRRD